jgi:hypothetical protein
MARCVDAPQSASAGTSISPMESRSIRVFCVSAAMPSPAGTRAFFGRAAAHPASYFLPCFGVAFWTWP